MAFGGDFSLPTVFEPRTAAYCDCHYSASWKEDTIVRQTDQRDPSFGQILALEVCRTRVSSPQSFLPFSPMLLQVPVRAGAGPISQSCRHLAPNRQTEPERIKFTGAIRASMIGRKQCPERNQKGQSHLYSRGLDLVSAFS